MHVDFPDGTQTEKVGDTLLGDAVSEILALPPVPLVSQTQIAYPTVSCASTELTLPRVCTVRHKVAGGGVVVGVVVGVGVAVVVGVAVTIGDLSGPPGVSGFDEVLRAGPGCGSAVPGEADEPGLGCGRTGGLALGLGWVLGSGGAVCALVCAGVVCPAAGWLAPPEVSGTECLPTGARRTVSARSTGMPAGCRTRVLEYAAVRVRGSDGAAAVTVGAGDAVAEAEQGFAVASRVPCTPVRSMLTAP